MLLLTVTGVFVMVYAYTEATTVNISNAGVDSSTCGATSSPCRSISQAIVNGSEGDTIVVGPGRYGDLNRDGIFGQPGEEMAPTACGNCMILVDKTLTLESRDGAGATVLDAAGAGKVGVSIEASNVVFGKKGKGFALIGSGVGGSTELRIVSGTSGVTIVGNQALGPGDGFLILGTGHLITDNIVTGGSAGFIMGGNGHRVTNNVASGNISVGFGVVDDGHTVTGNVATGNGGGGFIVQGNSQTLTGNVASSNERSGFNISGSGHTLSSNVITENFQTGIRADLSGLITVSGNNIFGNGTDGSNCGLINESTNPLIVSVNFWGAATGPGHDPADMTCATPGNITIESFAKKEFKIRVTTGQ
jgi:parallel beta-helix repeat protein